LLQPKPLKRGVSPEFDLASQEDVDASLERDRALTSRALRQREEIANAHLRFRLWREKVYLGFEVLAFTLPFVLAAWLWLSGDETIAVVLLGGGAGFGGLAALLHRRGGA